MPYFVNLLRQSARSLLQNLSRDEASVEIVVCVYVFDVVSNKRTDSDVRFLDVAPMSIFCNSLLFSYLSQPCQSIDRQM